MMRVHPYQAQPYDASSLLPGTPNASYGCAHVHIKSAGPVYSICHMSHVYLTHPTHGSPRERPCGMHMVAQGKTIWHAHGGPGKDHMACTWWPRERAYGMHMGRPEMSSGEMCVGRVGTRHRRSTRAGQVGEENSSMCRGGARVCAGGGAPA